jgi:hypothetical protein
MQSAAHDDPACFPERALKRRNFVIEELRQAGVLTSDEALSATTHELKMLSRPCKQDVRAP